MRRLRASFSKSVSTAPASSHLANRRSGRSRLCSGRLNVSPMRALPNLRRSIAAVATIFALLFVPACGSLCATMTHCSTNALSAESEGCHHSDTSAQADSDVLSLSSQTSCGQQTPPLAILWGSDSSVRFELVSTANAQLSIYLPMHAVSLFGQLHNLRLSKDSPQQSIPLANLTVLRT